MIDIERAEWPVSPRAAELHREALVWDNHAGFAYESDQDLLDLERWRKSGVNYLSVNVGFDVPPWNTLVIEALSSYRRQFRENAEHFIQVSTVLDVLRAKQEGKLAVAFDIEGMDALNGDAGMVEIFYELGVRQMLFAYNRNNLAGGGCHDENVGLTQFGRAVVKEMNRVGMIVDCSHCSQRTSLEAIELSESPVIFSHSNARRIRDHERNIIDEQVMACAAKGGAVGVTGVGLFIGPNGASLDDLVDHIDYFVQLVGPKHVGVGMDSVLRLDSSGRYAPRDRSYWPSHQYPDAGSEFILPEAFPRLTEMLIDRGYKDADVRGILGENFFRIAESVWK